MKKLMIVALVGLFTLPSPTFADVDSATHTQQSQLFKRKKAKGYRKKKGFLWGLFRKNDCGCPKH
ncbi:MAG: hypothetical protein U0Y10_27390 [Spirosomataceae bacterium]